MKYRKLGNTDISVSLVAAGMFGMGGGSAWTDTQADSNTMAGLLSAALDCGINLIDTAPVYGLGDSETLLGHALTGQRDKFVLQTKCALNWRSEEGQFEYTRDGKSVYRNLSAKAIRQDLEDSLKRLRTDYIDVYITHRQTDRTPVEETMGALMKLMEEGKIRAVGISNASPEILENYHTIGPVALVQEKFSLLSPGAKTSYIPTCEKLQTTFQVYGSLEASALAGREHLGRDFPAGDYRTHIPWFKDTMKPKMQKLYDALSPLCEKYNCSFANLIQAWTIAQSEAINLLIGVRQVKTLRDTARAVDIDIEKADLALMQKAADALSEP